jgi:hypothetical protein
MTEMRKRSSKSEIRTTVEASSATTSSSKRRISRRWICRMMMAFVYRVNVMVSEEDEGRFEDAQEGVYDEEMEEDIDEEE